MIRSGIRRNPLFDDKFHAALLNVFPLGRINDIMRFRSRSTKGVEVMSVMFWRKAVCILGTSLILCSCGGSQQVTQTQKLSAAADAPYKNVLVIFLAESFDSRRYLETEIVKKLAEHGTHAVRSTSMMDTKTPVTRQTFVAMVDEIDADAVLVTQLAALQTKGTVVDMNPQATYNFRPTYYYNVFSVELTEYVAPQAVDYDHKLSLATQMYSVKLEDVVWAMESNSNIHEAFDKGPNYKIYVDEAGAIVTQLLRGGLIAR
jgi:hypothetical protein